MPDEIFRIRPANKAMEAKLAARLYQHALIFRLCAAVVFTEIL